MTCVHPVHVTPCITCMYSVYSRIVRRGESALRFGAGIKCFSIDRRIRDVLASRLSGKWVGRESSASLIDAVSQPERKGARKRTRWERATGKLVSSTRGNKGIGYIHIKSYMQRYLLRSVWRCSSG